MAYKHFSNGMPDDPLRWSPQSSNGPNSCGAWNSEYTESKDAWLSFYALADIDVPAWAPGTDIETQVTITADHGGQSWVMISCADNITEEGPWTYLERATGDRDHHYLPSSPHIYAWPKDEITQQFGGVLKAKWAVPSDFSCPGGRGVGRWVWKTGNTCNDNMNLNTKKTEPFNLTEFKKLNDAQSKSTMPTCSGGGFQNEYFITCFDFSDGSTPAPTPPPAPPADATCCWSKWGALNGCGNYPSGASGGHCNTGWATKCTQDGDCKNLPPAPTPPAPPPSPTTTTAPPSPSPVAPDGDVDSCHDAAKAFCDDHNYCKACQGYGTWGDMFFVVKCNDGKMACNIPNLKGDVCQCQQQGGCSADGATCPGPPADGFLV